jgi:hypothetical protein
MNAFDLDVTVALGSTSATILLNQDVALAEGVLAGRIRPELRQQAAIRPADTGRRAARVRPLSATMTARV